MGKKMRKILPCCKNYRLPLYCVSWVPLKKIREKQSQKGEREQETKENEIHSEQSSSISLQYLVLGGGGGQGKTGHQNALLLTEFNFSSRSLSEQPVNKFATDDDIPLRMAMHPGGEGLICSFSKSCRWFELDASESMEAQKLAIQSSGHIMIPLKDVGLQMALTFNNDGSILATGGEDGHLRVLKWPSMEVILDRADAHASVKDLDISLDGKFLVTLGDTGPCRIWDLTSAIVANLPRENGEVFCFCRFARRSDGSQILYVASLQGKQAGIVSWSWNTVLWKRVGSKKLVRDPISAFNASADGKLLAIGTIEGDIAIISSSNMQMMTVVKRAHIGIVTALTFSHDSRAVASTSFDSTVRVTMVEDKKRNGLSMWIVVFVIILSFMAYLMK